MSYDKDQKQHGPMTLEELQEAFEESNSNMKEFLEKLIAALEEMRARNCELPPFC